MAQQVRSLPLPLSLSDFDVGVTLGTGSFGRVRFSTHRVSGFSGCAIPLAAAAYVLAAYVLAACSPAAVGLLFLCACVLL